MSSPINWQRALDQVGGSEEVLRDVAQVFLEECPGMMKNVREADNAKDLRRAAHTLKGSVDVFGADAARDAALQLEMLAKDGKLEEAPAAIEKVEAEIEKLLPALKERV